MQLTSLSKSFRAAGLMTLLSVMVATTLQQPVQAQNVLAKDKNGVCTPLPEGVFYQEFGGITFSPAQKLAYRKIEAKIQERFKVVVDQGKETVIPGSGLTIEFKPGIGDKKAHEISDVTLKTPYVNLSTPKQVELLTQKYGKYAIFSVAKSTIYSPEVVAQGKRISRDFEAQTMAILTPEQQKIYKTNLALSARIRACGLSDTPIDRLISPLPY